ncbi:MAG TPA: polymer-forming cytoskeletal protein [Rhodocyclaceae bacterium]
MSEKNDSSSRLPKSIDSLIGAGVRIEANVNCTGVLRVQGDILGNVSCDSHPNGTLIVDSAGSVTGTVSAAHVSVKGRIVGPVRSQQSIEIHDGGSLVGDVAFKELAIHSGGIVEGMLSRIAANESGAAAEVRRPEAAGTDEAAARPPVSGWKLALALLGVAAIGGGIWLSRNPHAVMDASETALKADAALNAPEAAPASLPAAAAAPKPPEPVPVAAAASDPPAAATPEAETNQENITAVRGINPSRPANMFLLISNEPSVLYRKKRDEAGDGARITVPAGEKASVGVSPDELIRVAQGRDVVILFQGAKVPRNVIESGAWISFVPK